MKNTEIDQLYKKRIQFLHVIVVAVKLWMSLTLCKVFQLKFSLPCSCASLTQLTASSEWKLFRSVKLEATLFVKFYNNETLFHIQKMGFLGDNKKIEHDYSRA